MTSGADQGHHQVPRQAYWPPRDVVEGRIGSPIPTSYWSFHPWGRKLLIKMAPRETRIGAIHIPDAAQEQMGMGWVINAGPQVGDYEPSIDCCHLSRPQLAGAKVIFSKWSGTPLMAHSKADESEGEWLVIREGDVFGWLAPTEGA